MMTQESKIMAKHFEVVCYSSIIGLLFPLVFLLYEKDELKDIYWLVWPLGALYVIGIISFLLMRGDLFSAPVVVMRFALYAWGATIIVLSGFLIFNTGGVQSSLFVWMLEYALLLSIIIRQGKWSSVIWVFIWCLVVVVCLMLSTPIPLPQTFAPKLNIWGGTAISLTLFLTLFSAFVAERLYLTDEVAQDD